MPQVFTHKTLRLSLRYDWLAAPKIAPYLGPMRRYATTIELKAAQVDEYRRLHAAVWPGVLKQLQQANVRNYSIFHYHLPDGRHCLFGYYEYHGLHHVSDMNLIAADAETKRWWALCSPMQRPLDNRGDGEWWAAMDEVFHCD